MKRALSIAARASAGVGTLGAAVWVPRRLSHPEAGARPSFDPREIAARAIIVVAFSFLAVRFGVHFMQTGHVTGLMLLASEALVVVLTVLRRTTGEVDRSGRARTITAVALTGPLIVSPVIGAAVLPEIVTALLSASGLLIVITGKLSLGRSFGLMPANRGVVSTGLYRRVRHPIYMGYLITHAAFLFANPTIWNIAALVVGDLALMIRAGYEERILARDPAYRDYLLNVRWRVVPGLY